MPAEAVATKKVQRDPVPMELFGKDHWSLLGYIDCRCTDNRGIPDNNHMRTDHTRHPALVGIAIMQAELGRAKYPTRLKGMIELANHDDWDCADDLEAAGLLKILGTGIHPFWKLTTKGKRMAAQLRAHKQAGGNFAGFEPGKPKRDKIPEFALAPAQRSES